MAFTESLKKKGFDTDGNVLDGSGGSPLTGTAQLTPLEDILKTRQSDLVIQTDAALEAMLIYKNRIPRERSGGSSGWQAKKQKPWTQGKEKKQGFTITKKRM